MTPIQFEIAASINAEHAADLFLDGKDLNKAEAVNLFRDEFSFCENHPDQRVYFLASTENSLVAYAGARFYNQDLDENMYQTVQLLPTGWYLRGLKVHPRYRRFGIAREMTKRRLAWLTERTKIVFVFLNDKNKETIPMYFDFGFKTVSTGWEFLNYEHKRPDQRGVLLQLTNWVE